MIGMASAERAQRNDGYKKCIVTNLSQKSTPESCFQGNFPLPNEELIGLFDFVLGLFLFILFNTYIRNVVVD